MRFFRAVVVAYWWASVVTGFAALVFLFLYKDGVMAPAMGLTRWQAVTLLLRLHFDTFLWVWAVTGMVLSCMHAVATKPIISIRIDGLAPPGYERGYTARIR
jgi:hypothetical protein